MSLNLSISPPILEIIVKPGSSLTQAYQITNNDSSNITVTPSVLPFAPHGYDGSVSYDNLSINPNIEFNLQNTDLKLNQPFTLQPHETKQLVLKIKTLSNIPQTDSYYTFFLSQNSINSITHSSTSQAYGRIGSHILISSSTTENQEISASISHIQTVPRIKDIFLTPISISAQVNNTTNHYFKIDGKMTITKNGQTIKEWKLYPQNVLSNYSRQIQCADTNFQPVDCSLPTPLWPGAYTLQIDANSASASTTFFVFPFSLLAIIILLSLLALLPRLLHSKT